MLPTTERLPVIAVIGESHADPMTGACALDSIRRQPVAVAAYAHIPGLRGDYYLDPQGRLHPKIVTALCSLRLLLGSEPGNPRTIAPSIAESSLYTPEWCSGWRIHGALAHTPLLFISGEVDARQVLHLIPPHADVPVPFKAWETERIPTFEPTATVSEASITAVVQRTISPMFRAMLLLRDIGFTNIALHSISPPSPNDAEWERATARETRVLTRYKVIMLFNAAMRTFCEANNLMYIDRWHDFTDGGLVRDGYNADALHIKDTYMRESLSKLYALTLGQLAPV